MSETNLCLSHKAGKTRLDVGASFPVRPESGEVQPKTRNQHFLTRSYHLKPQTKECYYINQVNIYASF